MSSISSHRQNVDRSHSLYYLSSRLYSSLSKIFIVWSSLEISHDVWGPRHVLLGGPMYCRCTLEDKVLKTK